MARFRHSLEKKIFSNVFLHGAHCKCVNFIKYIDETLFGRIFLGGLNRQYSVGHYSKHDSLKVITVVKMASGAPFLTRDGVLEVLGHSEAAKNPSLLGMRHQNHHEKSAEGIPISALRSKL